MLDQLAAAPENAEEVVRVMRVLADSIRLRLLAVLRHGEFNVTELRERLGLSQPNVSHHLGVFRSVGLVETRRKGKHIYYRLSPKTVTLLGRDRAVVIRTGGIHLQLLDSQPDAAAVAGGEPPASAAPVAATVLSSAAARAVGRAVPMRL